jgi:uncharacterized protein YegL
MRAADDTRFVLAFYVVVDVSQSMQHANALANADNIVMLTLDAIDGSPTVADVIRFAVFDFSDDARVLLRLDDHRGVKTVPPFVARGRTSYAAAFRLLRAEIENDMSQLKLDGYRVYRPVVFLLTDGAPTDDEHDLRAAYELLTDKDFPYRPNIVPFGVGEITKDVLDPWVYPKQGNKPMRSYVYRDRKDPATAINQLAEVLVSSIVASAESVIDDGGSGGFVPPDEDDLDEWI